LFSGEKKRLSRKKFGKKTFSSARIPFKEQRNG
jgi:hypothetical protein